MKLSQEFKKYEGCFKKHFNMSLSDIDRYEANENLVIGLEQKAYKKVSGRWKIDEENSEFKNISLRQLLNYLTGVLYFKDKVEPLSEMNGWKLTCVSPDRQIKYERSFVISE